MPLRLSIIVKRNGRSTIILTPVYKAPSHGDSGARSRLGALLFTSTRAE